MSLIDLACNDRTDKNTLHSYLPLYAELLLTRKETAKNVLEVGIYQGGSIKLWKDYFKNAVVHGVDVMEIERVWTVIRNDPRIILHTSSDAYDQSFVKKTFVDKNLKFDFMLDDGPHTLESMKSFIKLYSPLLTKTGILIIEDVQSWDWIELLKQEVPTHLKKFVRVYDLRKNKDRYDDIVFTINQC